MGRVSGKVAIVTGAGSGQGAAEAKLLAKEGAKVIATDIAFDNVKKVVEEINANAEGSAIALKHDVSSKEEWLKVIEEGEKAFGSITVLINNAGIITPQPFENISYEEWTRVMDINIYSQFAGMQAVVPSMKKADGGSIINIGSIASINSSGGISPYTASKGATNALSKAAAVELGQHNIRVNTINPGTIETPLILDAFKTEEAINTVKSIQPLKRIGKTEDIAYYALYLASDESYFTNGSSLSIDGGVTVSAPGSTAVDE